MYSTEVEEVLYRHPAVLEAAVFGIPDARWGEAVHAVVVPRAAVTEAELLAHCRAAIAGHKVPTRVDLRTEALPKSGAGKILKRELRAPFWAGHDALLAGAERPRVTDSAAAAVLIAGPNLTIDRTLTGAALRPGEVLRFAARARAPAARASTSRAAHRRSGRARCSSPCCRRARRGRRRR